jgi:hypothetical protein
MKVQTTPRSSDCTLKQQLRLAWIPSVEWIHCRIVHPKPRNEPPEVLPPGGWQPEIEPPEPEPQKPERAEPTPERLERWKQHVQELERRGIGYDPEGKKRSRPGDGTV